MRAEKKINEEGEFQLSCDVPEGVRSAALARGKDVKLDRMCFSPRKH